MRLQIYQINHERDTNRHLFLSLKKGETIDPTIYDEVFDAVIETGSPEDVFTRFNNTDAHPLYHSRSLSVSDVIVIDGKAYHCQNIGFSEITFDASKTQRAKGLMRIVYVEPQKPPYASFVMNDLDAMQRAVGGYIEPINNRDGTYLVGNEEAKLKGMAGNRRIGNGSSVIAGPFFVVGDGGTDFRSLTDAQVDAYMARFAEPENIPKEDVENDMHFGFLFLSKR